jgi:hypothetical protein
MSMTIYDKTDKGREELSTRKYQLAPRSRSLLVLIDGKQTVSDLLKKIAGLGLNQQSIQDLFDQEFITISQSVGLSTIAVPSFLPTDETKDESAADSMPIQDATSKPILVVSDSPEENARRFQAISKFFNETIKSTLGFRGFTLQLKVERAANIQEFEDLRNIYIEAILKAKGKEVARGLRDRLDQLLYAELQNSIE